MIYKLTNIKFPHVGVMMQIYNILTDDRDQELTKHGDFSFPCAGYDEKFSEFIMGEVPWHWHDEIEIVVVWEGSTKVECIDGSTILKKGDGIFINSRITHKLTQIGDVDCRIINFVLKHELLGGNKDSRISREFVSPICFNKKLSTIDFRSGVPWQKEAITKINKAFESYNLEETYYEIEVVIHLLDFWRLICVNRPDALHYDTTSSIDGRRINEILEFIDTQYTEKISISDIASVAGVSSSECFRLFNRTLKCSPNDYLLKYRLQKATVLLLNSDKNIQEISFDTGFNSAAYFCKKFKELFDKTPLEFRHYSRIDKELKETT